MNRVLCFVVLMLTVQSCQSASSDNMSEKGKVNVSCSVNDELLDEDNGRECGDRDNGEVFLETAGNVGRIFSSIANLLQLLK